NRDDHDVGAARQHSEEERPADERQERNVQGRRAPGHEASVTGWVTRSAGRVTPSPAGPGDSVTRGVGDSVTGSVTPPPARELRGAGLPRRGWRWSSTPTVRA